MSRPWLRAFGVVAVAASLTGCLSPTERSDDDMSSATAAPLSATDAAAAAPDLLANGGLALPADSSDIEVDIVTYGEFREVSVTRFTAPRAAAEAVCTNAGSRPTEARATLLTTYEKDMLGTFAVQPGMTGCEVWADPKTGSRVFISADEPARVTVLTFRMPSR